MTRSSGDSPFLSNPTGVAYEEPPDASTGLPWPRTWPGVYLFVMSSFVTWVGLLLLLEWVYS
jgi:hypothetical protein